MRALIMASLATLLLWGCASPENLTYHSGKKDGGARDRGGDLVPHHDIYSSLRDGGADGTITKKDAGCLLGTVNNCSSCGDVCPPGADSPTTLRVCLNNTCDIQCRDENYDVDSSNKNGCEASDDLPVHNNSASALSLGKLKDNGKGASATAKMPSDARKHLKAPVNRPHGREDWFVAHITDTTFGSLKGIAKLDLSNLPTGSSYTAKVWYECDNGKKPAAQTATVAGGSQKSITANTKCNATAIGDDSGKLYVQLTKTAGAHSALTYKLEILP